MNIALRYGLMLGFVSILMSTLTYLAGTDIATNMWVGIGMMLLLIGAAIFFSLRIKRENVGVVEFGQAFLQIFVMVMIAWAMSNVFGYVLTNLIDPEYADQLMKASIHRMESQFESMGMAESDIERVINESKADMEAGFHYAPLAVAKNFIYFGILGAIFSALMAIFVRRKPENSPFLEDEILDMKK